VARITILVNAVCVRPILALSAAALFVSCGGDGGTAPAPRFVVATHGSADFETDTVIRRVCPRHLDFSILLQQDGIGWVSLEHPVFGSVVFEVAWTQSGDRYDIEAGEVRVRGQFQNDPYYAAEVGWEDLTITVRDEDGDGSAEIGTATATLICDYEVVLSPETETDNAQFDLDLPVESPSLSFVASDGLEPIFRSDLQVVANQPLLAETLPESITMLVGGAPVAGTVTAVGLQGPLANGFRFDADDPLPFGAEITIDPGDLLDAFGRAVEFDGSAQYTVNDPGPFTDNPSFEGQGGWIGLYKWRASIHVPAIDGPINAAVYYWYPAGQSLVGYLDVPDSASELSLYVADEEFYDGCSWATSSLWLVTPGGSRSMRPPVPDDPACEDWPVGCTIPWTKVTADLTGMRGQRIVLLAEPAHHTECRPDFYDTLHLDGITIR
jgi:hypothetical protein